MPVLYWYSTVRGGGQHSSLRAQPLKAGFKFRQAGISFPDFVVTGPRLPAGPLSLVDMIQGYYDPRKCPAGVVLLLLLPRHDSSLTNNISSTRHAELFYRAHIICIGINLTLFRNNFTFILRLRVFSPTLCCTARRGLPCKPRHKRGSQPAS